MVMFRDFAQRHGRVLDIVGEAENLPDGTVRVVAEGKKEDLEAFIRRLRKGPILARVEDVMVTWQEPSGAFAGFSIRL